jgi:hypothetical protein
MIAVSYWSLGAVLWGAFRLGRALFTPPVALLAVVLIGSNFKTFVVVVNGFLDVHFMALLVWAAVLEVRRPRRPTAVLALLALAGMLRPEGWLVAAVYWVFACRDHDHRVALGLIVLAGPLAWAAMDLVVTGDPVFAFTNARHTQAMVRGFDAGSGHLLSRAVDQLRATVRAPVMIGGTMGFLIAAGVRRRSVVVPGALICLVLLAYAGVLISGLPQADRMLLTPAVMLALFCAYGALGWRELSSGPVRRGWAIGGVALVAVLLATTLRQDLGLARVSRHQADLGHVFTDLAALNRSPATISALRFCRSISVSIPQLVPFAAYYLDRPLAAFSAITPSTEARGAYLNLTPRAAPIVDGYDPPHASYVPHGVRRVAGNRSWNVYVGGC